MITASAPKSSDGALTPFPVTSRRSGRHPFVFARAGMFGVIAYVVSQRIGEMAPGSKRSVWTAHLTAYMTPSRIPIARS